MRQLDLQTEYEIEYASDVIERNEAIETAAYLEAARNEVFTDQGWEIFGGDRKESTKNDVEDEPGRKRLRRDLQREALLRLEESARTEKDFRNVVAWWDRIDANRERRERYYEVGRDEDLVPIDWGAKEDGLIFPSYHNGILWRQMQKGDFLDIIFNCPFEIHELTGDEDLIPVLRELKTDHKEVFFYLFVCLYSTMQTGKIRGQSDRNIRKIRNTILKKIRKKYAAAHEIRSEEPIKAVTLSKEQRIFLREYGGSA